jgi:hypothetical protein
MNYLLCPYFETKELRQVGLVGNLRCLLLSWLNVINESSREQVDMGSLGNM